MTSYLFSLLTVTTHALHLMSLSSNHHHHSKSLTAPSDILHFIFGTSFLHHSELHIRIIHPPFRDHHLNMPVLLATHCYHLPSVFRCFTLSSTQRFHKILSSTFVCFCLSHWSHSAWLFTWFICPSFLGFSSISFCFSYSWVHHRSWPALRSNFRCTMK